MNGDDRDKKFGFLQWYTSHDFIQHDIVVEPYDPNKPYGQEPVERDFGDGVRSYCLALVTTEKGVFVCAYENFTQEGLAELAQHCPCDMCKMSMFNIARYFSCRHCFSCLLAADLKRIDRIYRPYVREARRRIAAGQAPRTPAPFRNIFGVFTACAALLVFLLVVK